MSTKKKVVNKPTDKPASQLQLDTLQSKVEMLESVLSELAVTTGYKAVLANTSIVPFVYDPKLNRKYKANG
jgi:hypothetical protein